MAWRPSGGPDHTAPDTLATGEAPSIGHVRALSLAGATGLLICEAPGVRIDTFLLGGRIAWAMRHGHRSSFAAHLHVAPETLRALVTECRRTGQSLGDALVARGLATRDSLRTALAHEIAQTLALLGTLDVATRRFVDRGVDGYDPALTFELDELIPAVPNAAGPTELGAAGLTGAWRGSAHELRSRVDGLAWVEIIAGDQTEDADPPSPNRRTPAALVDSTGLDGAGTVAVHTSLHGVIGFDLGSGRRVWCGLRDDVSFGAVALALEGVLGSPRPPVRRQRPDTDRAAWTLGPSTIPSATVLTSFAVREPDIVGALVLSADEGAPIAGMGAGAISPGSALALARRLGACLTATRPPDEEPLPPPSAMGELARGVQFSGADGLWCYGAELDDGTSLWLFIDQGAEPGLGWYYLGAIAQELREAMKPRLRTIRGLSARALPPPAAMV